MFSFRDALAKVAEGVRHQVVVFEFSANNHSHRRALANALGCAPVLHTTGGVAQPYLHYGLCFFC
ncbi:MAG: hypothetical protein JXQ71_07885 [Verrucomicrobia bacterium]|nr:hypothetical protein [Verrucomicrobiota bacterium]